MTAKKRRPRRGGHIPTVMKYVSFEYGPGFVTAVIHIDEDTTYGLKFLSPEHMLSFMNGLMEHATEVWPDHALIRYYVSTEE
jgi:hypothetical protein